jgi:hypothetical protein
VIEKLEEQLQEYFEGRLSAPALEKWFVDHRVLESVLGEEEYAAILELDELSQEDVIWVHLRAVLGSRFPDEALASRARSICEACVGGMLDPVIAVREMRVLKTSGTSVWARFDRALASVPAQSQYALWDEKALAERLKTLEALKPSILEAAKAFLSTAPPRRK